MKPLSILLILIFVIIISGCSDFDEINTNPDATTAGDASMLLTGVELSFLPLHEKDFMFAPLAAKQIVWTEGTAANYQYNVFTRTDFSDYIVLENINRMNAAALNSGDNVRMFEAIGKFVKCYKLFYLSASVGDIPYSQGLQVEEGNYTPVYDTQKQIMISILDELLATSQLFKEAELDNENINGDIFYNGNASKWQKLTNTFYLNVLINLSVKSNDSDLDLVTRFRSVLDSPNDFPLFNSNLDNFAVVYNDKEGEYKPFYANGMEQYAVMSSYLVDKLKEYEDYRLFYYADPIIGKIETEFSSYKGLDPSAPNQQNIDIYSTQNVSLTNKLYYDHEIPEGIPYIILGYHDLQFILAEAAARGWIDKEPSSYYLEGIKASMENRMNVTPTKWVHNMPITPEYISSYLEKPEIQLPIDEEGQVEKIILQKFLASYLQNDWNIYFDYRRTGFPDLPINPETNKNPVSDKLPLRWMYPQREYDYNFDHVSKAISDQYGGKDEVTETMWMIQK